MGLYPAGFLCISLWAGRTGTRANAGKPQPRWEAGIDLARSLQNTRSVSAHGGSGISIGSRIRSAAQLLSDFLAPRGDASRCNPLWSPERDISGAESATESATDQFFTRPP